MKYTKLGNSDLHVSRICLGCMGFGDAKTGQHSWTADKYRVTMTEIALAWLLTKVDAPVAGATKLHHVEGAVKAVDLTLTDEDRNYLEELYVPHPLVGVMAQNTKNADREGQAWAKHAPKE